MPPAGSSEQAILERLARKVRAPRNGQLILGIGDDCAIFRPRNGHEDLLLTTDLLLEDVHFSRRTHPAGAVGHKALARGLSDIAAMGGEPRLCLVSLALPGWADGRWLDGFYAGLLRLAHRTGSVLAGGDLARAQRLACDIVVLGAAPRGKALRRSGARPGDRIYVSGRLGGSALGLAVQRGAAWQRHLRPEPRLRLGEFLRRRLYATAAIDLSDGLSLDLRRLCLASGVSASIEAPPLYPGASLEQALHGGEDYELLFTLPPRVKAPAQWEGVQLTAIGLIDRGSAGRVTLDGKQLAARGYDHFARR